MTNNESSRAGQDPNVALVPEPPMPPVPPRSRGGGSYESADIIRDRLEATGTAQAQITSILWFADHGRRQNLNQQALGELIEYDGSTVSRLLSGKYPTDIAPIIAKVDELRRLISSGDNSDKHPVCKTWVLTEIGKTCDLTRAAETVCILTGRSHTGKSVALLNYTHRNNHGQTIFVRMPPGGAPRMFLNTLAMACGISHRQSYEQLRDRLIGFFKPGMLLIVDEAHQSIIGRKLQTVTLEIIRDVHDLAGAAVVLCGTPVFANALKDDRIKLFFEQVDNRTTIIRKLPDTAPWRDVEMVIAAYGLPVPIPEGKLVAEHHLSPLEIVQAKVAKNGLGKLTKFLTIARRPAEKQGVPFAWAHVVGTDAMLAGWERGDLPTDAEQKGGR